MSEDALSAGLSGQLWTEKTRNSVYRFIKTKLWDYNSTKGDSPILSVVRWDPSAAEPWDIPMITRSVSKHQSRFIIVIVHGLTVNTEEEKKTKQGMVSLPFCSRLCSYQQYPLAALAELSQPAGPDVVYKGLTLLSSLVTFYLITVSLGRQKFDGLDICGELGVAIDSIHAFPALETKRRTAT
ncbi:hypothetical protein BO99DRAFT_472958 [Aspergillus violaceofuscus CBS 115571]|uniref:Uncharacterized protein n=1 Tax=Aspergillus violaceofuscus (strain CBS 115571) TaxID=1450538 RepID=A0A2V5H7V0_ASPV1|nr:hypothetical protein BO99DRAFT_472958 [Aspergillus violaceofuscus CBS 115571]